MVSVNVIAFVVLKVLHSLISRENRLQITTDIRKITKNVRSDLTFVLTKLLEHVNRFV